MLRQAQHDIAQDDNRKDRKENTTLWSQSVHHHQPYHFLNSSLCIFATMAESLSHQQLIDIGNEFGTPVYVYHAEKIKEQYNKLVSAFSIIDTKFFYACKALTNINILKYIHSLGCGIDCSS